MTEEEFISSLPYRLVERFLKRKHPWIKGISPTPSYWNNYDHVRFINIIVDPKELSNTFGLDLAIWAKRGEYQAPYISLFFEGGPPMKEIADFQTELERSVKKIQKSVALPEEYKSDKVIVVGAYDSI
jgi:hypothetical protein